jgi:hypothetical protein
VIESMSDSRIECSLNIPLEFTQLKTAGFSRADVPIKTIGNIAQSQGLPGRQGVEGNL